MRPAYVRGVGAVSALADTWPRTWRALLDGSSATRPWNELFSEPQLPIRIAAIEGLDRGVAPGSPAQGPSLRCAVEAAHAALAASARKPRAIYCGTTHSESDLLWALARSPDLDASLWRGLLYDSLAVGLEPLAMSQPCTMTYSSCASGLHGLLLACLDLNDDETGSALVVAADALSVIGAAGFFRAGALARSDCRPFRDERNGLLLGEGAAALLLASTPANERTAVLGVGLSCDAGHPTLSDPSGAGLERALTRAIDVSGLSRDGIAAVVGHGTGTQGNDAVEAAVLARVFRRPVPTTSLKAGLGHTMGAAGLFNLLAAVEISRSGSIPPTLGDGSPVAGIDLVEREPRRIPLGSAVVAQCSGFGGVHAVAVVGVA